MLTNLLAGFVMLEHFYIMYLEMVLWTTPKARKIFGTTEQYAQESAVMAKNQGLYNGFLAVGLLVSFLLKDAATAHAFKAYFLSAVAVAGLYGGMTVKPRIAMVQGGPAIVGLLVLMVGF